MRRGFFLLALLLFQNFLCSIFPVGLPIGKVRALRIIKKTVADNLLKNSKHTLTFSTDKYIVITTGVMTVHKNALKTKKARWKNEF